jgi:hypothetical protein
MCKSFFLEPGYLARCGRLWYEPGILLIVEAHERLEIFVARNGMPGDRCGRYSYAQLDWRRPPAGLQSAERGLRCPALRLAVVPASARPANLAPAARHAIGAFGLLRHAAATHHAARARARRFRWPALVAGSPR